MYPKTCKSRFDAHSQVIVANAEQEAELPEEFRPLSTGTGQTGGTDVMLSPAYDDVLAAREKLEKDRAEFAQLVAAAQKDAAAQHQELAEGRAKLQADRDELTAGYKASMEKLEGDRAKLEEDQRLFDEAKAGSQPTTSDTATAAPAAATATPAKRVRTAKAD
jgi:hypothetical protein